MGSNSSKAKDPVPAEVKSSNFTRNQFVSFHHEWTIDEINKVAETNQDGIYSPLFPTKKGLEGFQWKLLLKPKRKEETPTELDCFSLYVCCVSSNPNISVSGSLFAKNNVGERANEYKLGARKYKALEEWGFERFMSRETLFSRSANDVPVFVSRDRLTVGCRLIASVESTGVQQAEKRVNPGEEVGDLQTPPSPFSDVTVQMGGQEFRTHKKILAASSTVFAAMFQKPDFAQNPKCVIPNVEPELGKEFLGFFYRDECPGLNVWAPQLLRLAHKYDVANLKTLAGRELVEKLSLATAMRSLVLAHLNECAELEEAAMKIVVDNYGAITQTEAWTDAQQRHPQLIHKINEKRNN